MSETNELEILDNIESIEAVKKPKKVASEKQKEQGRINLAKGRESLAVKQEKQRADAEKRTNEMVLVKAAKIKQKEAAMDSKMKKAIGLYDDTEDDDEIEIEERIIKKPKKKKIIYREESDSEEEVIVRKKKADKSIEKPIAAVVEKSIIKPKPTILFY